jgi:GcrA cell cycle regulator
MWTDEAIDTLRRLAHEGRSASSIAAALGAPSRNAVIGKANRIGIKLGGANCPARAGVERPRRAIPRSESHPGGWILPRRTPIPSSESISGERAVAPAFPRERESKASWIFADAEVGEMRRVGLVDLEEVNCCRWPIGDPTDEDFAYCGLETAKGRSYCAGHCRMAYRPPKALAREQRREGDGADGSWPNPRIGRLEGDFTEMEVKEPAEPAAERFAEARRAADELSPLSWSARRVAAPDRGSGLVDDSTLSRLGIGCPRGVSRTSINVKGVHNLPRVRNRFGERSYCNGDSRHSR